jgi:hypothetical protein
MLNPFSRLIHKRRLKKELDYAVFLASFKMSFIGVLANDVRLEVAKIEPKLVDVSARIKALAESHKREDRDELRRLNSEKAELDGKVSALTRIVSGYSAEMSKVAQDKGLNENRLKVLAKF